MNERMFIEVDWDKFVETMQVGQRKLQRLDGLDVARLFAFIGMVVVNFNLVMGLPVLTGEWPQNLIIGLEGRAAASFVVLAGVGLGLSTQGVAAYATLFKRAAFLFVIGMINMLIFPADIIHYYAAYFVLAAFLLPRSGKALWLLILVINLAFLFGLLFFNYDAGWDWANYGYVDFWTATGFVRNLVFNGWHPILPWVSFLALGIWLSRLDLQRRSVQFVLLAGGAALYGAVHLGAPALQNKFADPELQLLLGTSPVPPTPLYMLAGASGAAMLIGACLLITPLLARLKVLAFMVPAGRQTLTLYMAHIVVGMGVLELFGLLENQSAKWVWCAALLFCALAIGFAYLWAQRYKRGPLESLMRKICG